MNYDHVHLQRTVPSDFKHHVKTIEDLTAENKIAVQTIANLTLENAKLREELQAKESAKNWWMAEAKGLKLEASADPVLEKAKQLYDESTISDTIHCNRFPAWFELSEDSKQEWLAKARGTKNL